jgi:eukaryotic-like serine/threonine-protein kinase
MEARILRDRYELIEPIAKGGMGTVWRGRDRVLDRQVAIKVMSPALVEDERARNRFVREARAIAKLQSRHVVAVLDHGVHEDLPFIVLELLHGEDLGARLRRLGPQSPQAILPWLVQLCEGLGAAHRAGIVHRDIKPSNLFMARSDGGESLKLVDFGVAKVADAVQENTATGEMVGSVKYMAPEQIRAAKSIDARADLWAVGAVLYVALTGRAPFVGDSNGAVAVAVCTEPHLPPSKAAPSLGKQLDAFFRTALAKAPADRFQSTQELLTGFVGAMAELDEPTETTVPSAVAPPIEAITALTPEPVHDRTDAGSSVDRLPRPAARSWGMWLAAAVVAAIVVAGVVRGFSSTTATPTATPAPPPPAAVATDGATATAATVIAGSDAAPPASLAPPTATATASSAAPARGLRRPPPPSVKIPPSPYENK